MNTKLKRAFEKASKLPDADQEQLAAIIEFELEDEAKWDSAFAGSRPQLQRLAEEALEEYRSGRTEPADDDDL